MILRQLFDHDSYTYTYLIADTGSRDAVLIDPVIGKLDLYLSLLTDLQLNLRYVLDTHTHADHITAMGTLRERTGCLTHLGKESKSECVDIKVSDNDNISIGSLTLKALYTPGHTNDSYSFYLEHERQSFVFTGDTLLIRGSGRTDFQNGNALEQYESLFERLLKLPEATIVYPGHDYRGFTQSTIAEEKQHNPRLQVSNAQAYQELMNGLNLPNPKMMDIAVPANQACGQLK